MAFELRFRQRASRLSERFVNERGTPDRSGGRKKRGRRGCGCAVKAFATAGIGNARPARSAFYFPRLLLARFRFPSDAVRTERRQYYPYGESLRGVSGEQSLTQSYERPQKSIVRRNTNTPKGIRTIVREVRKSVLVSLRPNVSADLSNLENLRMAPR